MRTKNFVVLDGMLGIVACAELREEVVAVRASGGLRPSKLAGGRSGSMLAYTHTRVRGDLVGWFEGDEAGMWSHGALPKYISKIDTLISQLAPLEPHLQGISGRSKAMVTCYPGGGSRYVRHCDNSCFQLHHGGVVHSHIYSADVRRVYRCASIFCVRLI